MHESVFGHVNPSLVQRVDNAVKIAATLPESLRDSTRETLKALNQGFANTRKQPRLPTRRELGLKAVEDRVKYEMKKGKVSLTVIGAVALVKGKVGDKAKNFDGELRGKERRGIFENA